MPDSLNLDYETFSLRDLPKVGNSVYARDPSTEALLLGWKLNGGETEVIDFTNGQTAPKILREAIRDPEVIKKAWNAPFERYITKHVMGIDVPVGQWRCTMVRAMYLSMPGKLEKVGEIVGLPEDKKKISRGKALIRKFCKPRKPTKNKPWDRDTRETAPSEWEEFIEYCGRDVDSEYAIEKKIAKWPMPEHEWEIWRLDREINERGIPINMDVVRNAMQISDYTVKKKLGEMADITGLQNPNSNAQLLPWLNANGYPYGDMKKGHIERALEDLFQDEVDYLENPDLYEILSRRLEVSKSSVKKFFALNEATDEDGMLRECFQYGGAQRTHRWAGRKYQPQNLAKPSKEFEDDIEAAVDDVERLTPRAVELLYDKPMDLLSSCVRPVCQAKEGYLFCDADLNAIENRVLGWLADDEKILDVFRDDKDPYIDFGRYMFGETYEDLWHEYKVEGNKEKRTLCKPGVLGCGYMLGKGKVFTNKNTGEKIATGLLGYAWNMGIEMTAEQSETSVNVFRQTFTGVTDFWGDVDKAMRMTIRSGRKSRVGFIEFEQTGPFVRMNLPSGTSLYYLRPKILQRKKPWGDVGPTITYEGLNDKGQWIRIDTHPGKITENAVQAVARDLLAHGMLLAREEGLRIPLHVHDQVVAMEKEEEAEEKLKVLIECMSVVPKWAPGLILGAEGFLTRVFTKD